MTTKQWKEKIAEQKRLDMQRRQDLMRRRLCIKDTNVVVEMGELYECKTRGFPTCDENNFKIYFNNLIKWIESNTLKISTFSLQVLESS